jgi:Flp pilus assembly protein TadG
MESINSITRPKLPVESKKNKSLNRVRFINKLEGINKILFFNFVKFIKNEAGSGMGTLFTGLAVILMISAIFLNLADYSIYTYKRNEISKALDYAVTAASQQIDTSRSIDGISNGFSDATGTKLLDNVQINIDEAAKTFLTVFYNNFKVSDFNINNNLLLCTTVSDNGKLKFTIKVENRPLVQGELNDSLQLEGKINKVLLECWPDSGAGEIYVDGNPKTNNFEKGTYILAVLKDLEVKGLFSDRKISLTSFAGAKLIRHVKD